MRDLSEAAAECPVDADHHIVAFLDQIRHHAFHPGRPGAGNRKRDPVGGAEDQPQHLLDVLHDADEFRIEMPQHRREHRLHHARMDIGRTGPEQEASRRPQFRKRVCRSCQRRTSFGCEIEESY